jgi:hypothetical protein
VKLMKAALPIFGQLLALSTRAAARLHTGTNNVGVVTSQNVIGGVDGHVGPNVRDDQPSELSRTQRVLSRASRYQVRPGHILNFFP